ncbi:hypothetical protein F5882DRAFT_88043 [Hyaloscypha sp. PMI_1271]|nr:hypothetical protein F5882DRAFT_88043 [Hyaloscypha sp. PMI_1271]
MSVPKDCAATPQHIAGQALLDEKRDGPTACSPSPIMEPLDINSSEPWDDVARSSSDSPSFENRVTDVLDVTDIGVEVRKPPIQKRKRLQSPADKPGLKRSRVRFVNADSAAATRKVVAKVRQNSPCKRCRRFKKQGNGDLPCDSCISGENSKCLWAQPCVSVACSDLDLFGIGYEVIFGSPLPDSVLDETDEYTISHGFSKKDLADELDLELLSPFDPVELFRTGWKDIGKLCSLSYLPANLRLPLSLGFRK